MKRCICLFLLLFACAPRESGPKPAAAQQQAMKVGLLTPGSVNDNGWNAIAYEGLQRVHRELGAEVSNQETKTPAEIDEGFRSYGAKGFNLAFGHGFEFQDAAIAAGKQFPKTVFITTSGSSVAVNVSPMVFELEQATYLLGIIAARESKTGKAGLVGGIKLPSIESTFIAFEAGAHSVNPKFEVKKVYTGNFDDVGAAKLATLSLIKSGGVDYVFDALGGPKIGPCIGALRSGGTLVGFGFMSATGALSWYCTHWLLFPPCGPRVMGVPTRLPLASRKMAVTAPLSPSALYPAR